jgi:putative ABC transport system substrate-binding protein
MTSKIIVLTLCVMLLVLCVTAEAQPTKRVFRIGYLTNDSVPVDTPRRNAFRQGLRDLGYVEGENIVIEYRIGEGRVEKLTEMAEELVRLKVDVIFAFTTSAAQAAKKVTKETPIVMGASGDPVALGFVESLARPGGTSPGLSPMQARRSTANSWSYSKKPFLRPHASLCYGIQRTRRIPFN